jgi:hypothetical protein
VALTIHPGTGLTMQELPLTGGSVHWLDVWDDERAPVEPLVLTIAPILGIEPGPWDVDVHATRTRLLFIDARLDLPPGPDDSPVVDAQGRNCSATFGRPEAGCSDLEILSATLERLPADE